MSLESRIKNTAKKVIENLCGGYLGRGLSIVSSSNQRKSSYNPREYIRGYKVK